MSEKISAGNSKVYLEGAKRHYSNNGVLQEEYNKKISAKTEELALDELFNEGISSNKEDAIKNDNISVDKINNDDGQWNGKITFEKKGDAYLIYKEVNGEKISMGWTDKEGKEAYENAKDGFKSQTSGAKDSMEDAVKASDVNDLPLDDVEHGGTGGKFEGTGINVASSGDVEHGGTGGVLNTDKTSTPVINMSYNNQTPAGNTKFEKWVDSLEPTEQVVLGLASIPTVLAAGNVLVGLAGVTVAPYVAGTEVAVVGGEAASGTSLATVGGTGTSLVNNFINSGADFLVSPFGEVFKNFH